MDFTKHLQYTESVGISIANAIYPNDFDYYSMAFELIDSANKVVEYFFFPVMPKSIRRANSFATSVEKTFGGVIATGTDQFVPFTFKVSGTFGRSVKVILNGRTLDIGQGLSLRLQSNFDEVLKTGYGITKRLEQIFSLSESLDEYGKPYKLLFYNNSFGENYWVVPDSIDFYQDESTNMVWNYDFSLTAISPILEKDVFNTNSILTNMTSSFIQKRGNESLDNALKIVI